MLTMGIEEDDLKKACDIMGKMLRVFLLISIELG